MQLIAIVNHADFDWHSPQVHRALLASADRSPTRFEYLVNHEKVRPDILHIVFLDIVELLSRGVGSHGFRNSAAIYLIQMAGFDPHAIVGKQSPFLALIQGERDHVGQYSEQLFTPIANAMLQLPTFDNKLGQAARIVDNMGRSALLAAAACGASLWLVKLCWAAHPPTKANGRIAAEATPNKRVKKWLLDAIGGKGPIDLPHWPPVAKCEGSCSDPPAKKQRVGGKK